jgi:hypothetical protein
MAANESIAAMMRAVKRKRTSVAEATTQISHPDPDELFVQNFGKIGGHIL